MAPTKRSKSGTSKKSKKRAHDEVEEEDQETTTQTQEANDVTIEGEDEDAPEDEVGEEEEEQLAAEEEGQDDEEEEEEEEEEATPGGKKLTLEEKAANRKKRANNLAKTRGYRKLATTSGLGTKTVSSNILRMAEVARACQYVPDDPKHVAYDTLEEYAQKLAMHHEPLPRAPCAVVRASVEVLARQIAQECVLRTYEMGMARVTPHTVHAVCRPLAQATGMSSAMPRGLIRHAQITNVGITENATPALSSTSADADRSKEEAKMLPKQNEMAKAHDKKRKELKTERAAKKARREEERAAAAQKTVTV